MAKARNRFIKVLCTTYKRLDMDKLPIVILDDIESVMKHTVGLTHLLGWLVTYSGEDHCFNTYFLTTDDGYEIKRELLQSKIFSIWC